MAKVEWGAKHSCQSCGAKYYDLNRSPIVCPSCGTTFNPDALLRSRRTRGGARDEPAKVAAPVVKPTEAPTGESDDNALDNLIDTEDDESEEVIEDASELGEDDSDVTDVVIEDEDS